MKDDGTGAEPTLMVNLGPDACNQLKRTLTFFGTEPAWIPLR